MVSRIGYHVHSLTGGVQRGWTDAELAYFWQHLEALQPTVLLFKDNRSLALEAVTRLADCRVILRRSYDQDGVNGQNMWDLRDANWHLDTFAADAEGGLALSIWDRPAIDAQNISQFAENYAAIMDAFGEQGIPIVGPNFGVGFPNENWLSLLEPMWRAFDEWADLHDYSAYEYGTHLGMVFYEPESSFNVYPYRVGRQTDLCTVPYLKRMGHVVPTMVFTEWGIAEAHDNTNYRGWRTSHEEDDYATELIKAARQLSQNRAYVRGFCVFSYGDDGKLHTADDWSSYNIMDAVQVHQALEQESSNTPAIMIEPLRPTNQPVLLSDTSLEEEPDLSQPILPLPPENDIVSVTGSHDILKWQYGIATIEDGAYVNVRNAPDIDSERVTKVFPNMQIFYQAEQINGWWYIKVGEQFGYASAEYLIPTAPVHQPYKFPYVVTLHAENEAVARQVVVTLMDNLQDEFARRKDDVSYERDMLGVSELSVSNDNN